MRRASGTGNKLNMSANIMLVGKETHGNKITALYTLNKNGVRQRVTKSEFLKLAGGGKILNCKFNGKSLVGLEESLRNIPIYDKQTGMKKNNVTEEQVIESINEKIGLNKLQITAKLKHNNYIIGYLVANKYGQERRMTRETTYRLVKQGFLEDYSAKLDNGVPYVYGGNISTIPEISVDSKGKNITAKIDDSIGDNTSSVQNTVMATEHEYGQGQNINSSKGLNAAEKEKHKQVMLQKRVDTIDKILNELGNTSVNLRNIVQKEMMSSEINAGMVSRKASYYIHKSYAYQVAADMLSKFTDGIITSENKIAILTELGKVKSNIYDISDYNEISALVLNKLASVASNSKPVGTVVDIDGQGRLILENVTMLVKCKRVNVKPGSLTKDILDWAINDIEQGQNKKTCLILLSNCAKYKLKLYINNIWGTRISSVEADAIVDKLYKNMHERVGTYISIESINNNIDKLMGAIKNSLGVEIQLMRDILNLTVVSPYEIKELSKRLENSSFSKWHWKDKATKNAKITLGYGQGEQGVIEGWTIKQLDHCTIIKINNKVLVVPEYITVINLVAIFMINYQILEQSRCYVEALYNKSLSGFTLEWVEFGGATLKFRSMIQNTNTVDELVHALRENGFSPEVLKDLKEIKRILKEGMS